ncbi:MAG: putative rane protein [Ilumatobacteraceae bacterium]|nr:putative rane protein [Ilumatobacteraceae bacterium]
MVQAASIVVMVVIVANAMPLTGVVDINPFDVRAALDTNQPESWLPGQHTIDPNDGFTADALGHAAAESWLHGHVPYWNSDEGLGTPLAGEMQAGAFSPFVLLLHFSDGLLYLHVLLEIIAGVATLFFLTQLGLRRGAATLGGVLFALNGTHAWLTNAVFAPIAFLPVIMLGVECCVARTRANRRGGFGLIVAGISLSLLAGFPEVAYIDALLVVGWSAVRLWQMDRSRRLHLIGKLAGGVSLGVMIAAPALVAFSDFVANADVGAHGGALAAAHLNSDFLFTLVLPYSAGMIAATGTANSQVFWGSVGGYLGMSVVALALYGLFQRRSRAAQVLLAGVVVVLVVRIFGLVSAVTTVLNKIPGVSYTAFDRYSPPVLEFAVVVLAAFGADRLLRRERNRRHLALAAGGTAIVLLAASLQARARVSENPAIEFRVALAVGSVLGAAVVGFGILACAAMPERFRWAPRAACGLAALEVVVLFALPQLSANHNDPRIDRAPIEFLRDHLGTSRFFSLGPISPNYGSALGIAQINVNDLPVPKRWGPYVVSQLNSNAIPGVFTGYSPADPNGPDALSEFATHLAGYRSAGVRYLVTFHTAVPPDLAAQLSLQQVLSSPGADIFELPDPTPYFTAPDCALVSSDRTHAVVQCTRASTLKRLEMPMAGWTATVDGRSVRVDPVDDVFQQIALPAGQSSIVFTFEPPHIRWAWAATFMAFAILIGVSWRNKRHRGDAPASADANAAPADPEFRGSEIPPAHAAP